MFRCDVKEFSLVKKIFVLKNLDDRMRNVESFCLSYVARILSTTDSAGCPSRVSGY